MDTFRQNQKHLAKQGFFGRIFGWVTTGNRSPLRTRPSPYRAWFSSRSLDPAARFVLATLRAKYSLFSIPGSLARAQHKRPELRPDLCVLLGAVIEEVRTVFEQRNDATIHIPNFYHTPEHTISQ